MKKLTALFLITGLFMILGLTPVVMADTVKKKYTLHLAEPMPISHTITKAANLMAKRADELSGGKIKIIVHAGGSMFKDHDIPEATMTGGCDIAIGATATWSSHIPGVSFFDVPFLIPPSLSIEKLVQTTIDFFDKSVLAKGGKLLDCVYYGEMEALITTKKQVKKPGDVKGLKLRIYDRSLLAGFKNKGAAPMVMSSKEVYIGLQRGILDGAISGISSVVHRKWMEVCDYALVIPNLVSRPSHPFLIVANKLVWQKMEPAAQKIMMQVAKEARQYTVIGVKKAAIKNLARLGSKVTIYELEVGSLEWKQWQTALGVPGKKQFLKDNPKIGPQLIEIIDQLK